jgi:hypothetical protein
MDTKQVNDALDKFFQQQRIIFWNDPDREFVEYLNEPIFAPAECVKVIRLDQTGALQAKLQIERDDPNRKFLVYSPAEEPNFDDDWLLDIRLYSHNFRADLEPDDPEEPDVPDEPLLPEDPLEESSQQTMA